MPGHKETPRSKVAHKLVKEAVGPIKTHRFHRLVSMYKRGNREKIGEEWQNEWQSSERGKHLRQIDNGLPSKRAQYLYGPLPRNRAYLLAQLRTGHSWLATHAKVQRFSEDDKCECGAKETVVHVLVDCPKLRDLRQQLRSKIGDSFNNISAMLGGKAPTGQGKSVLNAVLDFAEASQRFQSRASEKIQKGAPRQRDQQRP